MCATAVACISEEHSLHVESFFREVLSLKDGGSVRALSQSCM